MSHDDPSNPPEPVIQYAGFHHSHVSSLKQQSSFLAAVFSLIWIVGAIAVLGGTVFLVWVLTSNLIAGASPVLMILIMIAMGAFFRGVNRARAVAALNYLEQAVRLNLPLPQMMRAAELGERGAMRKRMRRLGELLEDGHGVAGALDHAAPGLPPRAIGLIVAGERNGRLASTLARLAVELRRPPQRDPSRGILLRWYPPILVLAVSGALFFLAVFVMPKLEHIFRDFNMSMPPVTRAVLGTAVWLGPPVVIVMCVLVLMFGARVIGELFAPRWTKAHLRLAGDLPGLLGWWVPVARGVVRSRGLADVCHVLADAASAGRALPAALRDAARLGVSVVLRRRVDRWAEGVERGEPLSAAARDAGMPRLVCDMLATTSARGAADAAGVFTFLARYYDTRFSRSAALLEAATLPAMVLVFAFLVGATTLGLFLPLVRLMDGVAALTGFN